MKTILSIKNLNKNFGKNQILKNINFCLKEGEIISVLGKSGCGKSTLLRIIADLESKNSGEIKLHQDCKVAMMFQNYALFPHLNVRQNIEFALHKLDKNRKKLKTDKLLEKFKISDVQDKMCDKISGGQAQRVAFARAVANEEKLLLLDEPFSNLDYHLKNSLRYELKKLIKQNNISAIIVTHDKEDAFVLSDKIALISNGEILDINEPKNLYFHPKNIQTAKFLGQINVVEKKHIAKLDNNFKTWLEKRNFMFRPEEIIPGDRYSAKVTDIQFLGSRFEISVYFNDIKFKTFINSYTKIEKEFKFDLI